MYQNIELLAPAGNKENFIGAINAGANAVYLAGKNFGARKYASNFTNSEIAEMIQYAHLRNVRVFVTVNTIIFENEIDDLLTYTDFLVRNHVDALIVQDIGVIEHLVHRYPDTEIHASTQMNVYNENQARYLKDIGVKRVILARETAIENIKKIKENVDIDLEVFIHGALCVSYSGNCLFSALNGGRSGNRGECAQPCRLPYTLLRENKVVTDESYLMSTKDLLSIRHINQIIESGVSSLKIEGRMRSFEYVTATVRAYRKAIDNYFTGTYQEAKINELKTVFNREYTKGYISDEKPYLINNAYRPNHQGIEVGKVIDFNRGKTTIKLTDSLSKNDGIRIIGKKDIGGKVSKIVLNGESVPTAHKGDTIVIDMLGNIEKGSIVRKTMDTILNTELDVYKSTNFDLIPLYMNISCFVDKPLSIKIQTPFSEEIEIISDYIVSKARNNPQTSEQITAQFSKLGNTHYYLEGINIESDFLGFIPNSVMNSLRRESISKLETYVLSQGKGTIVSVEKVQLDKKEYNLELIVKVENESQYNVARELGIKTIYYKKVIENNPVFLTRINEDIPKERNLVIQDFGLSNSKDKVITTNEHLNVVNSLSVESLLKRNIYSITLSEESTLENTRAIISNFYQKHKLYPKLEVIMYNRPDLMISKYCPITKGEGINQLDCGICEKYQYYLEDQNKKSYPMIRDYKCNVRILHHQVMNKIGKLSRYLDIGIKRFRLDFTTESVDEVRDVIQMYQGKLK